MTVVNSTNFVYYFKNITCNFAFHVMFKLILPHDVRARRLFATSGALKKVQEIQAEPGTILMEYIMQINCCFPEEIIRKNH
ncbi:sperm-associated antigen 6 [Vespula maculifrons]|uniref:Sperm-associated antigen 6 n=1 Tax=Vespula maculifrons TaxID=7453 RepID=A0ABD2BTK3_VESMC